MKIMFTVHRTREIECEAELTVEEWNECEANPGAAYEVAKRLLHQQPARQITMTNSTPDAEEYDEVVDAGHYP